ncbi:MAG: hypothetical protein ACLR23_03055 [Clostridia bacterium]
MKHRKQNILVVLLHFGCAFVLVFGFYLAEFNGMSLYYFMKEKFDTLEYEILIPQGTVTTLGSTVPVKMGVTGRPSSGFGKSQLSRLSSVAISSRTICILYMRRNPTSQNLCMATSHGVLETRGSPLCFNPWRTLDIPIRKISFPTPLGALTGSRWKLLFRISREIWILTPLRRAGSLSQWGGYSIGDEVRLSLPVVSTAALNYQEPLKGNVEIHWYTATVTAALKSDRKIDNFPSGLLFSYGVMIGSGPETDVR